MHRNVYFGAFGQYTVFQKSDAKIQITITTAYLIRLRLRWRSHHSIRHIRKLHGYVLYRTRVIAEAFHYRNRVLHYFCFCDPDIRPNN